MSTAPVPPEERASEPTPRASGPEVEGQDPAARARGRGLSAPAVALLSLALTVGLGAVDGATSGELGRWFSVGFVVSAVGGALSVRRSDLHWSVIWPPLVFATAIVLTAPVVPGGSGGDVKRQVLEVTTSLALEAPLLVGTTLVAALVAVIRWQRSRGTRTEAPE